MPGMETSRAKAYEYLQNEVFLKWVEPETPPSLKKNEKYGFLAAVALYFNTYKPYIQRRLRFWALLEP